MTIIYLNVAHGHNQTAASNMRARCAEVTL
jgi:hypothetical protein